MILPPKLPPLLRLRAESLLQLHNGICFVSSESNLAEEFERMAAEGLVTLDSSSLPGWDVKSISYVQPELRWERK